MQGGGSSARAGRAALSAGRLPWRLLGSGWGLVAKRALADRLVLAAAFLVVLLAATLVAAIPIYAGAVALSGLHERIARAPVTTRDLQVSLVTLPGDSAGALDAKVAAAVGATFGSKPVRTARSGLSGPFALERRIVVFGFYDDLPGHARLTAGHWPAAAGGTVEVALPDAAARALDLKVGDELSARSRLDGSLVAARVVGLYRVRDPSAAFWWNQPLETAGSGDGEVGPLVATRGAFLRLGLAGTDLRWRLQPQLGGLGLEEVSALRDRIVRLPGRLNEGRPSGGAFEVDTGLGGLLGGASQALHVARGGVLVPSIQLGLLALWGLLFTSGLLVERRRLAIESLRLRGASAAQIVTLALMEAGLLALPAAVVAPWLAAVGLRALDYVGPLAGIGLRLDPRVGASAYGLALAAGAVCVAGLALPALRARRVAVADTRRRLPLAGLAQRARLDLVLVVAAALGYWQLRRYRAPLLASGGGLSIDPFLVAAPAVLLLAGALLVLRAVPLASRLAERAGAASRGLVASLGSRQLSRRPRGYARAALLIVLAVAIGIFAATYSSTWHTSQVDQARYAAGADVLVQPSGGTSAPLDAGLGASLRGLGAREALPAASDTFQLSGTESGTLLALDASRAAGVVHVRSDFAGRPLAALLRPLAAARGSLASLPLPGRPQRLAVDAALRLKLRPGLATNGNSFFGGAQPPAPTLYAIASDRSGVLYDYRLGTLPPNGTARRFVVALTRGSGDEPAGADYPLRLVGLDLNVNVSFAGTRTGTLAVRSLEIAGADDGWRRLDLGVPDGWRGESSGLRAAYRAPWLGRVRLAGDGMTLPLSTGQAGQNGSSAPNADFYLRPGLDSLPRVLPVLASASFLRAANASVGQTLKLSLTKDDLVVHVVGAFREFPTLDPGAPAVVADLPSYLDRTFRDTTSVVVPGAWWLAAPRGGPALARRLLAPPWSAISAISAAERQRALLDDPVALGVVGALALGFVVAAAFAALGFAVSVAASARSRTLEFAVLRALGLRTGQLSGWILLEHVLTVALALAGGTALGLVVSWLVLPYVALGAGGSPPVPAVRVVVPWTTILWLELGVVATLAAVAAVQVRLVRRVRPAPVLRRAEGAVAP